MSPIPLFLHRPRPDAAANGPETDSSSDPKLDPYAAEDEVVRSLNVTKGTVVAERVVWATGAAKRRGLLGTTRLDPGTGMYIVPSQWIHTFGMRYPIDVAFLNREGRVLAVHHALPPNRLSRLVVRAEGVLELAAGALRAAGTAPGDVIELAAQVNAGR
jgi:uncharacterized protein